MKKQKINLKINNRYNKMGNLCIKTEADDKPDIIIFEEIIDINPNEFNSDYKVNWDNKKKILIYKT
tara:strand:- start:490 stop:687 length:198 start_codon:yes stop_codon:yes gene_type:complete